MERILVSIPPDASIHHHHQATPSISPLSVSNSTECLSRPDPSDTIQTLDERWDAGWSVSKEARTEKNLISIKQVQGSCLQQPGSDHTTLLSSLSFDYFREDLKEEDIQSARHLQLGRVQRREQSISQSIDDCYTRHKISTVSPYTGPHCANSHQTEFHQEVKRCNVDLSEPKYLILFL